jgi:hypothetical protein
MGDLMNRRLIRDTGSVTVVRACKPVYVKYKPDKYCLVQYELELCDGDGESRRGLAHAALYPLKRAQKVRARLARTQSELPYAMAGGAVYLDDLPALVQI